MYCPIEDEAVIALRDQIYADPDQRGRSGTSAHDLAIFFVILALGQLFAVSNPKEDKESVAYARLGAFRNFNQASQLLSDPNKPLLLNVTTSACQCLHLMVTFLLVCGEKDQSHAAWPLLGLQVRLCQSIGLHQQALVSGREGSDTREFEKCRIWWESCTYDALWVKAPSSWIGPGCLRL